MYGVVGALKRRTSGRLLAFKEDGRWTDITSSDINDYIKDVTGDEGFSAKDFRTWKATVLAAVALAVSGAAHRSPTARKRAVTRAIAEVAHYLGNTPTVCRTSYVDPRVFDRFRDGLTIGGVLREIGEIEPVEEAVLDLLDHDFGSPAIVSVA